MRNQQVQLVLYLNYRINRFPEFRFWSHGSKVGAMAPDLGAIARDFGTNGSQLYEPMAPGPSSLEPQATHVLKVWSQTIDGNNNQSRNKLQQSAPLQIEMTLGKTKFRTYVLQIANCVSKQNC